ncbi:MAG: cytochrome c peroxidase [Chloroherpetonaceae bacterium]|nr:cytochrome c peroxidase [Chloroherpetonaceae bacterium]
MKNTTCFSRLTLTATAALILIAACSTPSQKEEPMSFADKKIKPIYQQELDSLVTSLKHLDSLIFNASLNSSPTQSNIQDGFARARKHYKRMEFLTEYYAPATSEEMNGPALETVGEEFKIEPPTGFQVLEEKLFPSFDLKDKEEVREHVGFLIKACKRLDNLVLKKPLTDDRVFDAMRLEIARIITLGITGFDSPIAQHSLREAAYSLEGIKATLNEYGNPEHHASALRVMDKVAAAISMLHTEIGFDDFNRLEFILSHANPISEEILLLQENLKIPILTAYRPFDPKAKTIFSENALSSLPFAPEYTASLNPLQVELGYMLFHDTRLSRENERSCGSCHNPDKAFTDGLARAKPLQGNTTLLRNTPTVINSGFQSSSSYDQRTLYLEDRVKYVVHSQAEMNSSLEEVARKLNQVPQYQLLFRAAFDSSQTITPEMISKSIAMYMRSLNSFQSRFDQYVRGNRLAMDSTEQKGFNLFAGKAKCATCHFIPLFNGTVPPTFTETEAEVIGVPEKALWVKAHIDPDEGKMATNGIDLNRYMFKTPTLRNIALTAPYMHNGVYKTLDEVVRFYNVGGGYGIGIDLPNQTLPTDSLKLSASESKAIVAFMRTLTDTTAMRSRPHSIPSIR